MHITAYLFFNGNCAEALAFYEKAVGAVRGETHTYGGMPGAEKHVPADKHDQIMNASFHIGDSLLMASDAIMGEPTIPGGFSICINATSVEEAQKVFAGLSEGGTVTMALGKTFFSECYGQLVDRFGIAWMVIFEKAAT